MGTDFYDGFHKTGIKPRIFYNIHGVSILTGLSNHYIKRWMDNPDGLRCTVLYRGGPKRFLGQDIIDALSRCRVPFSTPDCVPVAPEDGVDATE